MINKTYSVSEIYLSKEEINMAVKEYIENHNTPRIAFPKSVTYAYNLEGNKLHGISVTLVYKPEISLEDKALQQNVA